MTDMDWNDAVVTAAGKSLYERALRKAKADGMREAAEIAYDFVVDDGDGFSTAVAPWMSRKIAKALRDEADKLDPSSTQ